VAAISAGKEACRLVLKGFYHDLQCRSGFGDRLLDMWAAKTIANLHDADKVLSVRWHKGHQFSSFVGDYDTAAFSVAGCTFVELPPQGAVSMPGQFSHTELNPSGIFQISRDWWQIALRAGMIWGNSSPDRLLADLAFYRLDPSISLQYIIDMYRRVACSTLPELSIQSAVPESIDASIGVHLRLGDKLVARETSIDMSEVTWRAIERQTVTYLEHCIRRRRPIFVCSDDLAYKRALIDHLRSKGGSVVTTDPAGPARKFAGAAALADFFALSRCSIIVQMTKYSTFSLASSLVGDVPLINFFWDQRGAGHRLDIWRSALRLV
jgi:hypothetical protein